MQRNNLIVPMKRCDYTYFAVGVILQFEAEVLDSR